MQRPFTHLTQIATSHVGPVHLVLQLHTLGEIQLPCIHDGEQTGIEQSYPIQLALH